MSNNTNTINPHPHAELIKAWADGAKIQYWNESRHEWIDKGDPCWYEWCEYRVKPEEPWKPKEGISYLFVNSCGHVDFRLWESNTLDERHYKIGNCFHLQSAAEAAAERVKAALKGELKISAPNDEKIQLDGKPLTDGEKALIRALRKTKIGKVYNPDASLLVERDDSIYGSVVANYSPIAFMTYIKQGEIDAVAALKQIQAEQESNNE